MDASSGPTAPRWTSEWPTWPFISVLPGPSVPSPTPPADLMTLAMLEEALGVSDLLPVFQRLADEAGWRRRPVGICFRAVRI